MKQIYPTIFTQIEDCVLIEVPDLEILTEGTDMIDAIAMARDAIGLMGVTMQDDGKEPPEPSKITEIDLNNGAFTAEGPSIVSLVDIDFDVYRRKSYNKMVRRNVTLPGWLNQEANASGLNVSKVLQEALMERLSIEE